MCSSPTWHPINKPVMPLPNVDCNILRLSFVSSKYCPQCIYGCIIHDDNGFSRKPSHQIQPFNTSSEEPFRSSGQELVVSGELIRVVVAENDQEKLVMIRLIVVEDQQEYLIKIRDRKKMRNLHRGASLYPPTIPVLELTLYIHLEEYQIFFTSHSDHKFHSRSTTIFYKLNLLEVFQFMLSISDLPCPDYNLESFNLVIYLFKLMLNTSLNKICLRSKASIYWFQDWLHFQKFHTFVRYVILLLPYNITAKETCSAVDIQKLPGSFCCYSNHAPKVIQPRFDAQSLCRLHTWLEHAAFQFQAVEQVFFAFIKFQCFLFFLFFKKWKSFWSFIFPINSVHERIYSSFNLNSSFEFQ
ncbi:hypothetical protein VP01_1832g3 [Puccinia sorghi]|uniref:Uncharacterized protein n=1 Tax=Puccinia sorghi TaxID=27349 RepID=A0A0L6VFQ4_9BASI|nr:hypothetical protein VP01_1832g3 [Puccinia sorghi]